MAEPLPHWQAQFLEKHQLPRAYLLGAQKWFTPVVELVLEHQKGAGRPWLVAINGSQGSGKTTFCDYLAASMQAQAGVRCIALSLDDFYLTKHQRLSLASSVHPLLATRGVPGTHDMALLARTLDALLAGEPCAIPRFDKAVDDRRPDQDWDKVDAPAEVILLEGWCMGVTAQPGGELEAPVNELEQAEDADGRWRHYVNAVLEADFPALYARIDEWVMLRAPSFECVYRWRLEQEQKLATANSGSGIMSEAEIARFIQFYQRLTNYCLQQLPRRVNHLLSLDEERKVTSYLAAARSPVAGAGW